VLLEIAWRAGRKPARGGTPNLICIAEPLDVVAAELPSVADRVTVILPWGALFRAVAGAEKDSVRHIAALCLPQANIEIVFSYDEEQDARDRAPLGLGHLDEQYMLEKLPDIYEEAGLHVEGVQRIPLSELRAYETTWAKRLAYGRAREVWRIRARRGATPEACQELSRWLSER
jgi:16S rRNA (adenine(1408)-N(1))-methyltransferase